MQGSEMRCDGGGVEEVERGGIEEHGLEELAEK